MQHFKLGFRNRSALDQIVICELAVGRITQLPENQLVNVRLAELRDTVAAVRASHGRIDQLRGELKAEITKRKKLLSAARAQTTYACLGVAANVNLDPLAMGQAGLELERPKHPLGKPAAPDHFRAEPHPSEGVVRLRWKRPLRRCSFQVQARPDGETEWKTCLIAVSQSCLAKDLTSGVKYWFRVAAVNAHGPGPWSNLVSARAK